MGRLLVQLGRFFELLPAHHPHGSKAIGRRPWKNYFLLAPTSTEGAKYEPQAMLGYSLKSGPSVSVKIGDASFRMLAKEKNAWLRNPSRAPEMIAAMRAGSEMIVKGTSWRGTETRYKFSLNGVTAALKRLAKCD
ncbi:invasion associated locus B family protein [Rhizobium herbae]